jgi:hypothetical protein
VLGASPNLTIDGGAGTDTLVTAGQASYSAVDYLRMNTALSNFEAVRFSSQAGNTTAMDVSKLDIGNVTALTFNAGANKVTEVAGQSLTLARLLGVKASDDGIVDIVGTDKVWAAGPTALTAAAAGYKVTDGTVKTVYGGSLNVTSSAVSADATLSGSAATVKVNATGGAISATTNQSTATTAELTLVASDLESLTVTLASARGTTALTATNSATANTGIEYLATFDAGTIAEAATSPTVVAEHLTGLSTLKVNGTGVFSISTGVIAAVDAKLTTIDVSGMTAFANLNNKGEQVTGSTNTDATFGFKNLSTTTITLNDLVEETVILGGALDTVITGSTVKAMDTIIGFQLGSKVDTTTGDTVIDLTKSDRLDVTNGTYVKFPTTATTLIGALTEAGASANNNLVFHFGGDTYVYVDKTSGTVNGITSVAGLDDGDHLVKLVGIHDLDLLIAGSANQTGVLI